MSFAIRLIFLFIFASVFNANLALAEDIDLGAGESIFNSNCAVCHAGGNNSVMPDRTLKKEVLEVYGMDSISAIVNQVTNGKNAMPAFGGRLSSEDINNVANFVLNQASTNSWDS